jgi:phosphatidylserine/phosphatidylglycerophosphate/cardiolipin synthase-like enzyme
MDSARERMLRVLWAADEHGRLGVYWPMAPGGVSTYVHSKVMVIDDRLLRIGSSNLNNRSLGFDSECDVAIEALPGDPAGDRIRREIIYTRDDLVAEHLGYSVEAFRAELGRCGSFRAAVDASRTSGRSLRSFSRLMVSADASPFAENDLMDPDHVPPSLTESARTLLGQVARWPLRKVLRRD